MSALQMQSSDDDEALSGPEAACGPCTEGRHDLCPRNTVACCCAAGQVPPEAVSSPVVPSVGEVPVEVPEEAVEELRQAIRLTEAILDGSNLFAADHEDDPDAWQLRVELLTATAGPADIAAHDVRVRAEERQRWERFLRAEGVGLLSRWMAADQYDSGNEGEYSTEAGLRIDRLIKRAAGSAVPVATPEPDARLALLGPARMVLDQCAMREDPDEPNRYRSAHPMADDPRIDGDTTTSVSMLNQARSRAPDRPAVTVSSESAVDRLMMTHPSWFKRLTTVRNRNPEDPGHTDALYAARTIAEAAIRGADAEDGLRTLLADQGRATRLIATTWVSAFGAAWEDCSPESRDMALIRAGHVLAALREVANGG